LRDLLLFVYALGRSVPIILTGTFTGVLKTLQSFGRCNELLEKIAGVVGLPSVYTFAHLLPFSFNPTTKIDYA